MYVLTNGQNYISKKGKLTTKIKEAKVFANISQAAKAKQNIKRTYKKIGLWQVSEAPDDLTCQSNISECDTTYNTTRNKVTSKFETDKSTKSYVLAESISSSYKELINYKLYLENLISKKEAETQDILHFVEFYDLNACEGYMIYKRLQQIRLERRFAKDELIKVNTFLQSDFQKIDLTPKKEKRSYTPRELVELFKGKWKVHKRTEDEKDE